MTTNETFSGVWTAVITPFLEDGSIDWVAYEGLVEKQIEARVTGVVVSGTTGEAPTLTVQEKISLLRKTTALCSGKIRVMAGTGSNNTGQSVELSKLAEDAGADSLLVVTPPYNKPSLAGLKAHFKSIAEAVKVPICLYHVPGRTAQHLSVPMLEELTRIDQIAAVKEASGDLGFFARAASVCQAEFLTGDDPTYLASLAVGGHGVISVVSNIFPKAMVAIKDAFNKGDHQKALKINRILMPMIDVLFVEPNPCPTKYILSKIGRCKPTLRLPLAPVLTTSEESISLVYEDTKNELKEII